MTTTNDEPTFQVLFGTESGNSQSVARSIVKKAGKKGLTFPDPINLAEYKPEQLQGESRVIIVISTWDEGAPPGPAKPFCNALFTAEDLDLSNLEYCVIALGDVEYGENFCKCGLLVDAHLARLGARKMRETAKLGMDFQVGYMGWSKDFFKSLEAENAA